MRIELVDDVGVLWFSRKPRPIESVMIYKSADIDGEPVAIIEVGTKYHKYNLQYADYEHAAKVADNLKELI